MPKHFLTYILLLLSLNTEAQELTFFPHGNDTIINIHTRVFPYKSDQYLTYSKVYFTQGIHNLIGYNLLSFNTNLEKTDSILVQKRINNIIQQNDTTFLVCTAIDATPDSAWSIYYLSDNFEIKWYKELRLKKIPGDYTNYINKIKKRNNDYYLIAQTPEDKSKVHFYILQLDSNLNVKNEIQLEKDSILVTDFAIGDSSVLITSANGYLYNKNWQLIKTIKPSQQSNPTLQKPGYSYFYLDEVEYSKSIYTIAAPCQYDSIYIGSSGAYRLLADEQIAFYQYKENGQLLTSKKIGSHQFHESINYFNNSNLLETINDSTFFLLGNIFPEEEDGTYTQILGLRIFENGKHFSQNNNFGEQKGSYYPYSVSYFPDRKEVLAVGDYSPCTGCITTANYIIRFTEDFLLGISNLNAKKLHPLLLFPNPASNTMQVKLATQTYLIEVFNTLGARVLAKVITPDEKNCTLAVDKLSNGLYFVKSAHTDGTYGLQSFIVNH